MRFRLDGTFDPESDRRRHVHALVDALTAELPDEAKLEMARLSGAKQAQRRIAETLVKSITAASGALGLQPIPLADLPFLLAFQTMLVSGIIYISGRPLDAKLATKFLTAMGANVGLGLVLREGARAVAKFVPVGATSFPAAWRRRGPMPSVRRRWGSSSRAFPSRTPRSSSNGPGGQTGPSFTCWTGGRRNDPHTL